MRQHSSRAKRWKKRPSLFIGQASRFASRQSVGVKQTKKRLENSVNSTFSANRERKRSLEYWTPVIETAIASDHTGHKRSDYSRATMQTYQLYKRHWSSVGTSTMWRQSSRDYL